MKHAPKGELSSPGGSRAAPAMPELVRQEEMRARLMIEAVRDYAIFMLDPRGNIISWGAGAERLKGYKADEIVGRHFSIFYTKDAVDSGHPEDELRQALAEGRYEEEGWRIRKDGTRFWANVVISAAFDPEGKHIGFTKVTRDLTARRQLELELRETAETFRLLVSSVKDYAIYMLDPHGRIVTWNSGAEHIKGYRPDEVMGKHFSLFYPPEAIQAGHPDRELEIAASEGRYEEEGWRVRKNGERFWASVVLTAVHDPSTGDLRGFAKVTRDLTERRRLELEARRAAEETGRERARAFEARKAVRQREEFISVAAHELRTPLTALQLKVQGVAQALKRLEQASPADANRKHAERLESAVKQVDRLTELVERLLDVSRIVQGRLVLNLEETDLVALSQQVLEDFRDAAKESGAELCLRAPPKAAGTWDRARIEQVLVNLVSNAIKYGDGKPVDVEVETTNGGVRLAVEDRGIGIAPEDIDRIFSRFERAAPARHYGGLGLGLYVARNIVEAHGGTIRVVSQRGKGSRFLVELPARPAVVNGRRPSSEI